MNLANGYTPVLGETYTIIKNNSNATITGTSSAIAGTYNLTVSKLAQAQKELMEATKALAQSQQANQAAQAALAQAQAQAPKMVQPQLKDADLVVLSGLPFEPSSRVLAVMIDGKWVYEDKDSD